MDSFTNVSLRLLRLSPLNVRRTDPAEAIDELAEDILVHGLQQNLVGHVCPDIDMIEIAAGGRRLQALQLLLERGDLRADTEIPVLIVDRDDAREISLSENLHKISLNPVDEFLAFRAIVDDHADQPDPIALCARRQGVPRLRVERALRLANLAPKILDALRDRVISVESARAYARVTDHALQLTVFAVEERRTFGVAHKPVEIREALRLKAYAVDHLKARYVGIDAYRAAGGRAEADLFAGSAEELLIDTALLDTLALQKAEADLAILAKEDMFGESLLTQGFSEYPNWPPAPKGFLQQPVRRPLDQIDKNRRWDAVGVYGLVSDAGDGRAAKLACLGWYTKLKESTLAGLRPANPTPAPSSASRPIFPPRGPEEDRNLSQMDDAQRLRRRDLTAAHIVLERTVGEVFQDGNAFWPPAGAYIPAIAPGPSEDLLDVAVIFRVPRAAIEDSYQLAEEQIEEEEQANDHVAAADAELMPISGGGATHSLSRLK